MKQQNINFWETLPAAFSVLAPMDDVTDAVFRQIVVSAGKPDVLFTEFTNVEGLMSRGRDHVIRRLKFDTNEHPIVAQLWGLDTKNFYDSAQLVADLGFDGIDLNMGCPEKSVVKKGACSGLINNPGHALEMIEATKDGSKGLPVSVKTRIGMKTEAIDEWIGFLLEQHLSALTIHLRTVSEESTVPAHWELMKKIVTLRDNISPSTILVGNGDVQTINEGREKCKEYGIEGIMYGRAIFSDPWLFNESIDKTRITPQEKLTLFLRHIQLFQTTWEGKKNFSVLKKFCKIYIHNIDNATEIREKVMLAQTLEEMERTVESFLKS